MVITYQATLLEKKPLAPHINYFRFSWPQDATWTYNAGQYMIFHIPQDATHAARRLYSIASPPSKKDSFEFIIEYVENGVASQYLATHDINTQITFQGPAGMFIHKESERSPVFLATGTGIAPMYAMIHDLLERGYAKNIFLFWGLKLHEDLYYFNEFKELSIKYPNFQFKICFSRETAMPPIITPDDAKMCMLGRVNAGYEYLITSIQSMPEHYDYYLCGSKHVVEALREYLTTKNVPKEQVFFEKFTS